LAPAPNLLGQNSSEFKMSSGDLRQIGLVQRFERRSDQRRGRLGVFSSA
jgi:hypothetical protein